MVPTSPWGVDADGVSLAPEGGKKRFHVETSPCSPCWDVLKVKMCSKLSCRVVVVGVGVVGAGGLGIGVNTSRVQVLAGLEAGILEVPSIMLRGD